MGGLAGHSDLPPPPPGMTTHERLTQLLETEIQHGHLLQARPPAAPPARRVPAARLLSHRLPPPHPHTHTASTRAPAHPRTLRTSKPAASRWSAHCARSCAGWARCRVRDAAPLRRARSPPPARIWSDPEATLRAARACTACPLNSQRPPRCAHAPWWVGHARPNRIPRGETPFSLHDPCMSCRSDLSLHNHLLSVP